MVLVQVKRVVQVNVPVVVQFVVRVESDFKVPNLLLSLRFKGSGCHNNSI
jgi:hypothetical protein